MNYKSIIKEALLKKRETVYDYGCVMINLNVSPEEWDAIQKMVEEEDIYFSETDPTGFGRELDPHVTILYGIHGDVPDEDVEELIEQIYVPEIGLQKISSFSNDQFDVLKFDIKSKDLNKFNKMFTELPHTTNYPNYHPHATICYLKKGLAEKYVKKLSDIEPIDATPSEITYSKPSGVKTNYKI